MIDTTTEFVGLRLKNPLIIASSTLTESYSSICKCEDNGAGAVIAKSCSSTQLQTNTMRRSYIGDRGWYLSSGFNREIQSVDAAVTYLIKATKHCHIPIFASVSELTLDAKDWINTCKILEQTGVAGIQLDLFYFENAISTPFFKNEFVSLLQALSNSLSIPIFPKLNINLPTLLMIDVFKEADIKNVAFLDSIKVPSPINLNGESLLENVSNVQKLSLYGGWQYPLTLKYLNEFKNAGFSVCAGGGIQSKSEIIELLLLGADLIQIATSIIFDGYKKINYYQSAIEEYMLERGYLQLDDFQGSAIKLSDQKRYSNKRVVYESERCEHCGKCYRQGFCSAITLNSNQQIEINYKQCESCSFCISICPTKALHFAL